MNLNFVDSEVCWNLAVRVTKILDCRFKSVRVGVFSCSCLGLHVYTAV